MRRRVTTYDVLAADPPWHFGDKLPGPGRGAEKHYRVLKQADIEAFAIPRMADDALLFLWRVASQVEEAVAVCRAWGFVPKSEIVWVKTQRGNPATVDPIPPTVMCAFKRGTMVIPPLAFGMGRYVRNSHEVCIIASRGRGLGIIADHAIRSVLFAPVGEHSAKPEAFYDLVDKLVDHRARKAELFARRRRPGWDCFGDELETER